MSSKTIKIAMFIILVLVYMVSFVQAVVMTVIANDVMRDMNLTPAGMGRLGSFYMYGYSGAMLFSGMITVWLGPRRTLSTLCFVSGVGGILFATSSSFAVAALGRMLCGIGLSSNMTSAFTLFTRWYPSKIYARLCALFIALGGLGTLLGIALTPALNERWGWRTLFMGIAVMTLAYSVLVALFIRNWPPEEARETTDAGSAPRETLTPKILWRSFLVIAKRLDFWRVVVWFACTAGIFFSFNGLWAMPYLKEIYSMSHDKAGAITSVVAFGYIVGAPTVSWIANKALRSYRVCLGTAALLTGIAFAVIIFRIDAMSTATIFFLVLLTGMTINGPTAIAHASAHNLFGARMAGIASGVFGCAAFLGGALLQTVCGELLHLAQSWGWEPASCYAFTFSPFLFCALVAAWAGYTLSKSSFPG